MANGQLLQELKEIKMDLNYIKEHMVDMDTILTPEEKIELEKDITEFKKKHFQ